MKIKTDDSYIVLPDVNNSEELINHTQFHKIQHQFLANILTLKEQVHSYVGDTYDSKITKFYERIENIRDYQHQNIIKIYKTTRYQIHQFLLEISKEQTPTTKDYLGILLHDCLYGIDYCFDAVASRFKLSFLNLKTIKTGLTGFIYNIRAETCSRVYT